MPPSIRSGCPFLMMEMSVVVPPISTTTARFCSRHGEGAHRTGGRAAQERLHRMQSGVIRGHEVSVAAHDQKRQIQAEFFEDTPDRSEKFIYDRDQPGVEKSPGAPAGGYSGQGRGGVPSMTGISVISRTISAACCSCCPVVFSCEKLNDADAVAASYKFFHVFSKCIPVRFRTVVRRGRESCTPAGRYRLMRECRTCARKTRTYSGRVRSGSVSHSPHFPSTHAFVARVVERASVRQELSSSCGRRSRTFRMPVFKSSFVVGVLALARTVFCARS